MNKKQNSLTNDQRNKNIGTLAAQLSQWDIPDSVLDQVHDAAKDSLDSVRALTEYEDGKASRLLTVVAFLSAAAAAVFARFESDYHWDHNVRMDLSWILPSLTFLAFCLYVLIVTYATFRIFAAIRPRFNVPTS